MEFATLQMSQKQLFGLFFLGLEESGEENLLNVLERLRCVICGFSRRVAKVERREVQSRQADRSEFDENVGLLKVDESLGKKKPNHTHSSMPQQR